MAWETRQFAAVIDEFTATLERQDRVKLAALLSKLADRGNTMKMPESKPLGGNLFELRTTSGVRVFYTFRGQRIVLLGGYVKKRKDIPDAVLRLMRKRSAETP